MGPVWPSPGVQRDRQGRAAWPRQQDSVLRATMSHRGFWKEQRVQAESSSPGRCPSCQAPSFSVDGAGGHGLPGPSLHGRGSREERRPTVETRAGPGTPSPSPTCRGAACSGWRSAGPPGTPGTVYAGERAAVHPEGFLSRMSRQPQQQEVPGGALWTWWPAAPEQQVQLSCWSGPPAATQPLSSA